MTLPSGRVMSFSAHRDTLGTGGYSLMLSFTHINVYSILFRSSLFKRSAACISDNFFKKKTHQKCLLFYNESIKCISISKCLYFCTYTQINHLQSKNKIFFLVVSLEVLFWLAVVEQLNSLLLGPRPIIPIPRDILPVPPGLSDLLPTPALVVRVAGQVVQTPGDGAGRGVVTLKHKGVHLVPDLRVRQSVPLTVLQRARGS